jgi:4-hydroxy-L-threonine phosphate dehydrogenase PdxA
MNKRLAFMIGDPAGVGPEITIKALDEFTFNSDIQVLLVGDRRSFDRAKKIVGSDVNPENVVENQITSSISQFIFLDIPASGLSGTQETALPDLGKISKEAGSTVYRSIVKILDLIDAKLVDGFVFAPFNKESMKLGGCPYASEFLLFVDHFNVTGVHGEINILDDLWTTRVTSHIAIRDVADFIKNQRILETIQFLNREMEKYGIANPKIAVSALNPHGGEKGMFGDEEITEIEPAVKRAVEEGINVVGPYPCDTVFRRIENEQLHGIISMYHDQSQVATKLLGFDRGITFHGGMGVPIATCAHGTAFDIAGTGKANAGALKRALEIVSRIIIA